MNVLVISAHPDDETFGCGGTLLKHKAESDKLFWLVATVPHEPVWSSDTIKKKAREVDRVAESYEMEKIFKLGLPAARIESIERADIIGEIFKVIKEVRPEIVYVVHGGDVHTDHRILFEVTCSVLKPYKMAELGVRKIICYETLSSTDAAPLQVYMAFIPNLYIDITSFIERKLDIASLYKTEIQPDPLPRGMEAIKALARYRGSAIAVEYAEAFMLIRELK